MKVKQFALIVVLGLVSTSVFVLFMAFKNSNDCDQLVIDTYELHSDINIPDVQYVNCYFNKELDTRISVYDVEGAIDLKKFELVEADEAKLRGINMLGEGERPHNEQIYIASGKRFGTEWTYVYDSDTKRLWAELSY